MSEMANSPFAGPSHKRQKTQPLRNTPALQGNSGQGQSLASGLPSGLPSAFPGSASDVPQHTFPQSSFDFNTNFKQEDPFPEANDGIPAFQADSASRNLSIDPSSPDMLGPGASPALGSNLPDVHTLLPDFPIQSVERHQSVATGAGTNATNSALPTPQQQQNPQFGVPNSQPLFPRGYTQAGAVARDDKNHGVWYFDPHDNCPIRLGHRHDMDGGVWFTNELGVTQSLLAMRHTEGIGFLLGVATTFEYIMNMEGTRHVAGLRDRIDPRALMRQAARIVHDNVPAEVLDREKFRVPEVADVSRLSETNRSLPAGHFWDPFHGRVVQYDISGWSGPQGGGQGGGAARSSRPSRQGTGPPGAGRP